MFFPIPNLLNLWMTKRKKSLPAANKERSGQYPHTNKNYASLVAFSLPMNIFGALFRRKGQWA